MCLHFYTEDPDLHEGQGLCRIFVRFVTDGVVFLFPLALSLSRKTRFMRAQIQELCGSCWTRVSLSSFVIHSSAAKFILGKPIATSLHRSIFPTINKRTSSWTFSKIVFCNDRNTSEKLATTSCFGENHVSCE